MSCLKYLFIVLVSILAACSSHKAMRDSTGIDTSITHEAGPSTATPPPIKTLTSWTLSGAIAAKSQKKAWTATLVWDQQDPNHYQIRLFGPLGGGAVMIEKNGALVTYQDGPKKITTNKPEETLQKQMGLRLPVQNLSYWVRGLPAPGGIHSMTKDNNNSLTTLKQAGYIINYSNYTATPNGNLPQKIQLQGHDLMIKLVIKHWN